MPVGTLPPPWVLAHPTLPPAAKLVAVALWSHDMKHTGRVWPSRARIAERLGMPDGSVRRALRALADAGAVVPTGEYRGRVPVRELRNAPDPDHGRSGPPAIRSTGDPGSRSTGDPVPVHGRTTEERREERIGNNKSSVMRSPGLPGIEIVERDKRTGLTKLEADAYVREVCAIMTEGVRRLDANARGPRDGKGNRDRILRIRRTESATVEDWRHVVGVLVAEALRNTRARPFVNLTHLARAGNFARYLERPREIMASADGIKIDDADRIRAMGHDPAHFAGVVERVERVAVVSDDPF